MGFRIKGEDMEGGRGRPLPAGTYWVLVEEAGVDTKDNGTQVTRRYGNIRTPDGAVEFELPDDSLYRIGARKVFARSWWDHTNEDAESIGQRELAREAVALGLMTKPGKGEEAEFPFDSPDDYVEAIAGRELKIRTRLRAKKNKSGSPMLDDDGSPMLEPEVVEWLPL